MDISAFCAEVTPISATRDLDALRAMGKVAILFNSYGLALDLIQEFSALPEAVFAVAVRSGPYAQCRCMRILGRFPGPIATISINALQHQEREAFSMLAR